MTDARVDEMVKRLRGDWPIQTDTGYVRVPPTLLHNAASMLESLAESAERVREAERKLAEAQKDSERLDWLVKNSAIHISGNDKRGWTVMDQSYGLTIVVRNARTYRSAIDAALSGAATEEKKQCKTCGGAGFVSAIEYVEGLPAAQGGVTCPDCYGEPHEQ